MTDKRRIKKYANRRLYDVEASRHVTVAELRRFIQDGESIEVIDDKTGADITRHILLQIIAEREDGGERVLSTQFLEQVVRFYETGMQSVMARHLDNAAQAFVDNQHKLQDQLLALLENTPFGPAAELSRKNLEALQTLQSQFMQSLLKTDKNNDEE